PGTRDPPPAGLRPAHGHHRVDVVPVAQDRQQRTNVHLRQTRRGKPGRGDRPGAPTRSRRAPGRTLTRPIGIDRAVVARSALGSRLLLGYPRTTLLSGWLLAVGGGSGLVGLWLLDGTAVTAGQLVLVVAGLIFRPASLWAYPRPR